MFEITFDTRLTGAVPSELNLSQREFNNIKREAWIRIGKYWARHFRPLHFTAAGAQKYAYNPRKGQTGNPHYSAKGRVNFWSSYSGRKQKSKRHQLPLVFTGESRAATRSYRVEATATSTQSKCRVVMRAPNLSYRHPASKIDMPAELTRITPGEFSLMMSLYARIINRKLQQFQKQSTTKHK